MKRCMPGILITLLAISGCATFQSNHGTSNGSSEQTTERQGELWICIEGIPIPILLP